MQVSRTTSAAGSLKSVTRLELRSVRHSISMMKAAVAQPGTVMTTSVAVAGRMIHQLVLMLFHGVILMNSIGSGMKLMKTTMLIDF